MTKRKTPPQKQKTAARKPSTATPKTANPKGGEGDYESAERYQREATSFARSGRVAQAAEDAREAIDGEQADELAAAEAAGRSRSRGEDPRDDDE